MQHQEQGGFTGGATHSSTRMPTSPKKTQHALPAYTSYENSRFQGGDGAEPSSPKQKSELTRTDVREARDMTLRQVMNIDDRVDKSALAQRTIVPEEKKRQANAQDVIQRGGVSYRDAR